MPTEPPTRESMNAEKGWHHLTRTLARTMPRRLAWSGKNREAIRALSYRGRK